MKTRFFTSRSSNLRNPRNARSIWTAAILGSVMVSVAAYAVPPGSAEEIRRRLEPFGTVCRAGESCGQATAVAAAGGPMSGQQVYDQFCSTCHRTGVGDAPILGNAEQWSARIAKGIDELMASTFNGLNAMPPRGTCMGCSDTELSEAVDYMVEQAQ